MKLISLHLPGRYIRDLDRLVERKFYPNRAEAIRIAIRDLLLLHSHMIATGKKRGINKKRRFKE